MRAFIGIPITSELRDRITDCYPLFKNDAGVKLVKAENLHITLNFLGDVAQEQIEGIKSVMDSELNGIRQFEIFTRGISAFPSVEKASVIWADCAEDGGWIGLIYERLSAGLEKIGFAKETRPYTAHITMGRCKTHRDISGEIKKTQINTSSSAGSVVLYKSTLSDAGAQYSAIYEKILTGMENR